MFTLKDKPLSIRVIRYIIDLQQRRKIPIWIISPFWLSWTLIALLKNYVMKIFFAFLFLIFYIWKTNHDFKQSHTFRSYKLFKNSNTSSSLFLFFIAFLLFMIFNFATFELDNSVLSFLEVVTCFKIIGINFIPCQGYCFVYQPF